MRGEVRRTRPPQEIEEKERNDDERDGPHQRLCRSNQRGASEGNSDEYHGRQIQLDGDRLGTSGDPLGNSHFCGLRAAEPLHEGAGGRLGRVHDQCALRRSGSDGAPEDLYDLRLADMYGMYNEKVDLRYSASITLLLELKDRVKKELEKKTALSLKTLAVNGSDLIKLGIPAGKEMGNILNELLNCVIEDPQMNQKETLLNTAKALFQENQESRARGK